MDALKLRSNCSFLQSKCTNPGIWAPLSSTERTNDARVQDIRKTSVALTSLVLHKSSELSKYLVPATYLSTNEQNDIRAPLIMWKNDFIYLLQAKQISA